MALNRGSDVGGELGVIVFESRSSASGKVLDATNARATFVLAECDGGSSPTESSFGPSRTAVAEPVGDLRLEASAVMAGERLGGELEEIIGDGCGVVQDSTS